MGGKQKENGPKSLNWLAPRWQRQKIDFFFERSSIAMIHLADGSQSDLERGTFHILCDRIEIAVVMIVETVINVKICSNSRFYDIPQQNATGRVDRFKGNARDNNPQITVGLFSTCICSTYFTSTLLHLFSPL